MRLDLRDCMRFDSATLPDHVKRLMPQEERRAVLGPNAATVEEAVAALDVKSERELQDQIIRLLAVTFSITAFRAAMNKKSTITIGHPDLWFSVLGKACAFEVKMPHNKLSADQEKCIAQMREEGWRVEVIYSVSQALETIKEWRIK